MSKPYHPHLSLTWWLQSKAYTLYMIRELSAIFIGTYALIALVGIYRFGQGPEAFAAYLLWLKGPLSVIFHLIALPFSLYHTCTWFNLTPKAMVVYVGEKRVPGAAMVVPNYIGWVVISLIIACIVTRS